MYDYPPRIHLSAEPFSANSRKCDITLAITGLNKVVTFDVVLDVSMQKRRPGKLTVSIHSNEIMHFQANQPCQSYFLWIIML